MYTFLLLHPSGVEKYETTWGYTVELSPDMVRPLANAEIRTNRIQRKERKSAILTDTPVKDKTEEEKKFRKNTKIKSVKNSQKM